jgi:hypothetical protein
LKQINSKCVIFIWFLNKRMMLIYALFNVNAKEEEEEEKEEIIRQTSILSSIGLCIVGIGIQL